jgi:hypothetical protein
MSENNMELARRAYDLFNPRDLEAFRRSPTLRS